MLSCLRNAVKAGLIAAASILGATSSFGQVSAELHVSDLTKCVNLVAGQSIDAGDVCFTVVGSNLVVNYTTQNGWELTEAHLWVGNKVDGYPMTKKGNPQIGLFPYNSGNITGATSYTFNVPLSGITKIDLNNLAAYCGLTDTIYSMAHAALRKANGSGGYETQTGWADGPKVLDQGSWAMRHDIVLEVRCLSEPPPPPPARGQETAIMFGNITLNQMSDICGTDTPDRWGWQAGPLAVGEYIFPIYAAAGNNVLANGTHIGDAKVIVDVSSVSLSLDIFPDFDAVQVHRYVGTAPTCSVAFGRDWRSNGFTQIDTSNGVYVAVHISAEGNCQLNGNFCVQQ